MTIDELLKSFDEAISRANERFEKLKLNAHSRYNTLKDSSEQKIEELNNRIKSLEEQVESLSNAKNRITELQSEIDHLKKQNEKIVTLQEQIEKLQIENQQKITLERENNKLRNENTRIVEEYRAWRERLKTLIKKMGLF
ncbi:MAG: FlxA-like family protein [Succinivibrionaceae bacterium]|nr:FlxA-like family protein [Succinivibrionaceae bacterium]